MILALAGCQVPIDTTQQEAFVGTLGEKIHRTFCQRFASADDAYPNDLSGSLTLGLCDGVEPATAGTPAHLRALADERARTVTALDVTMPEPTHDDLAQLLLDIEPLYDDHTLPHATDALAGLFQTLETDSAAPLAFARFSHRRGYRPIRFGLGITRPVLRYARLQDVTVTALGALGEGGVAHDAFREVLRASALEMATLAPNASTTQLSNAGVARDLLFREDAAFATATPRWSVVRDNRGIALPTGVNGATVPTPYSDANGDKLPDVDTLGRFVGATGTPLETPAPFAIENEAGISRDAQGRALASGGGLAFQHRDLDRTALAGLVRELAPWLTAPNATTLPVLVQVARALPVAMGDASSRTRAYGSATLTYPGFDPATGPAYDLLHAATPIIHRQETVDAFATLDTLLGSNEPAVAALIETALYGRTQAAAHPEASLGASNLFWDELLASVERMGATEGMLESVFRATDTDAAQDLDEVVALFMRNRDAISFNPADPNQAIAPGPLSNPVNRSATDADPANESLLQRSVYLIHDLQNARVCNKQGAMVHVKVGAITVPFGPYDACALVQIDNVAKAYVEALFGRFTLVFKDNVLQTLVNGLGALGDKLLETETGITGLTRHPTAEALARMVFAPRNQFLQDIFSDTLTIDGVPVEDRHCIGRAAGDRVTPCPNAIIFAWEKPITLSDGSQRRFLDALKPILDAMASHETGNQLYFGEISRALHRHYPSRASGRTQRSTPGGQGFSFQDDIRSYEPLTSSVFATGQLMHRLRGLIRAADGITAAPGTDGVTALAKLTQVMVDPARSCVGACASGSLAYRDGRRYICTNDGVCYDGAGGRARRYPSPLYLLLDALRAMDAAWVPEAAAHESWLSARSRITDQFFTTQASGGGRILKNRRALALLRAFVPFLRSRIVLNRAGGDAAGRSWASAREAGITETLSGPLNAGVVRLLTALEQAPEARETLLALLAELMDEAHSPDGLSAMLYATSDGFQLLDDDANVIPMLNALSAVCATNAADVTANGGAVDETTATLARFIEVLHRTGEADTHAVLAQILANAASAPATGAPVTRLETVMDVIAEVNRTAPDAGGPVDDADVIAIFASLRNFLTDDERGADRLYAVIQNRTVAP